RHHHAANSGTWLGRSSCHWRKRAPSPRLRGPACGGGKGGGRPLPSGPLRGEVKGDAATSSIPPDRNLPEGGGGRVCDCGESRNALKAGHGGDPKRIHVQTPRRRRVGGGGRGVSGGVALAGARPDGSSPRAADA